MTLGMLQIFTFFWGERGEVSLRLKIYLIPVTIFYNHISKQYYEILSIFSSFFIYWRQFSGEPFKHASSIRDHKK